MIRDKTIQYTTVQGVLILRVGYKWDKNLRYIPISLPMVIWLIRKCRSLTSQPEVVSNKTFEHLTS